MGASTKIEWTDHTFNPWRSCQHLILADGTVHPACEHCYAEAMAKRFPERLGKWGAEGTRIMAPEKLWRQPLEWNKAAEKAGKRARVFCASIADVFEDWQGPILNDQGMPVVTEGEGGKFYHATMGNLRNRLFALIDQTPWLDWQLLTKRPGNIRAMWPLELIPGTSGLWGQQKRRNVWLGTSISNQQTADELIPQLLQARELAAHLFLSAEPLLGPVDLRIHQPGWMICNGCGNLLRIPKVGHPECDCGRQNRARTAGFGGSGLSRIDWIDWIICGGESGQQARPMHPDWARSLRDQCQAAGVAFFLKQWGEWLPEDHVAGVPVDFDWGPINRNPVIGSEQHPQRHYHWWNDSFPSLRVGKKAAGRLLDGREWNEFPEFDHVGSKAPREEEPVR